MTRAARTADANCAANLAALRELGRQPRLPDVFVDPADWTFARDGTLSICRGGTNAGWLDGCSLPRRAADALLKRLETRGGVACFLAPSHAAQIDAALAKLRPEQAVIAVMPDEADLAIALRCVNFSADLRARRLWFASGTDWSNDLDRLFDAQPGLPTPSSFIRLPTADDTTINDLIAAARTLFANANGRRTAHVQALRQRWSPPAAQRICVVAPMQFRLWNDAGATLAHTLAAAAGDAVLILNADDPAATATAAVAAAAHACGMLAMADTARVDMPGVIADALPWITWVTAGRIPDASTRGPNDRLLLADARWLDSALRAGWPCEAVERAAWPTIPLPPAGAGATPYLALIADTLPVDPPPADLDDYSSHRLLWQSIAAEITHDPFVVWNDPVAYLADRQRRASVSDDRFPRARFVEQLVVPAHQQSIARLLINAGLPLRLHGTGWEALAEFAPHAAGPVASRDALARVAANAAAIVHVWPGDAAHPVDGLGRPVLRREDGGAAAFVARAKKLLVRRPTATAAASIPPLSLDLVRRANV